MKQFYPVFFHPEPCGYSVTVPDLDGCCTQGETMQEAVEMTQEAIGLYLDGEPAHEPSAPQDLAPPDGDIMVIVEYDDIAYKKKHNHHSVRKTLSLPAWLDEAAEAAHINGSRLYQDALKKELNLT